MRTGRHMEAHEEDYVPFLTFGEGDEEDEEKDREERGARQRN